MGKNAKIVKKNLLDLANKHSKYRVKKLVAQFTGMKEDTVATWLNSGTNPTGASLLKLMYFLQAVGYENIAGLNEQSPIIYRLGQLFAYNILSIEEIITALGLHRTDGLFEYFRRHNNPQGDRAEKMAALFQQHQEKCLEKIAEYKVYITKELPLNFQTVKKIIPEAAVKKDVGLKNFSNEKAITTLANMLKAITPLAEHVLSDAFTVEERNKLRQLSGDGVVFKLSNTLDALCGEKAREKLNLNNSNKKGGNV